MKESIISINRVHFRYPEQTEHALKDITFQVAKGEWLAIVGHNGSGKSTLAKMLNGLHYPQEGEVTICDFPLKDEFVWDIRRRLGMVFQNPDNQFVGTTVQDDVAFGLENNGVPHEVMVERVEKSLQRVGMLDFLNQEPHHLSGGQKQRVAIAGVIALQPDIILLDEATSMLDPRGREEVLQTVRQLKDEQDLTVISITHDLEEASRADRIIVLNKGSVYREGTPEEIFQMNEELVELGLDVPFPVKLSGVLRSQDFEIASNYLTEEELVRELWTSNFKK
ncbi:energy-coupling factor ABC transporter ATP-binding protein [Pseudobacillus badius]|uniref:energy-coupling factor ABC transporter ATP-binding protein n=1 Tax=Bacillus badius TaxID=1455 RepID=UPI0007B066BF|nr:energy-coupling factor ABC transporter ATP-binding protein [Bacillus badius]KZO00542.1 energy-coupling factor transporter ATPase [Bacillus badius]MED0668150.1 energy-coupling factor ABC transporter ATP-binding protein [Bacillus badius]OCS87324.1 energy-coupling factor transporter ATPase [Bacillus badius]OVE48874.1 energy-coupling factor transporter ATPase [Bacillus badius]TDW00744.1 energy-coupling factor transport system ATP-binding protein [Bacillus badius]